MWALSECTMSVYWPEDGSLEPKHVASYVLMTICVLCWINLLIILYNTTGWLISKLAVLKSFCFKLPGYWASNGSWRIFNAVWNTYLISGVSRGVGAGFKPPPPPKFRWPSKIVPNSTRLWKLLKISEFRRQHPKMFGEKAIKFWNYLGSQMFCISNDK